MEVRLRLSADKVCIMSRARLLCLPLVLTIIVAFVSGFLHPSQTGGYDSVAHHSVYCIGDSLTAADYFEAELRVLLGADYTVVNKGIGGNTTTGMLNRFSTDVLEHHPGFVVIWGGVNDIDVGAPLATIESNLQSMYTQAQNAGITVIAIAMSPWKDHAKWTSLKQTTTNNLRTWIKTTAVKTDYVVDVYPLLAKSDDPDALAPAYDLGDHLHLNSAAGVVIGQAIYQKVDFEGSGRPFPVWIIIGIAAAVGLGILAYFVRRRLVVKQESRKSSRRLRRKGKGMKKHT